MWNVVSCCSAKFHFFNSYGPSSPEMNSGDYGTRFMESHCIVNMSCKSAILKKSSNKWLYSGKPFEGCDVCISVFPQECRDISYMRWENKLLLLHYPVCPGKEAVKWVCVFYCLTTSPEPLDTMCNFPLLHHHAVSDSSLIQFQTVQ